MGKAGGRVVLVAGLLALLFGVIRGYEISAHVEVEQHNEKVEPRKFASHLKLPTENGKAAENEFDFLVFSQIWPGTYCQKPGICCDKLERTNNFLVHGFWPDYNDYSYSTCCNGPAYNTSIENYLSHFLTDSWPQLSCSAPEQCNGENPGSYWQYQWEKHGTCAYPTIPDSITYFMLGLEITFYDILLRLEVGGAFAPSGPIRPDKTQTYETSMAIAILYDMFGATPIFNCYDNMLDEIWICVSKDGFFQDCPSGSTKSCPEQFLFPPFEK